jgi:hypothetical protein
MRLVLALAFLACSSSTTPILDDAAADSAPREDTGVSIDAKSDSITIPDIDSIPWTNGPGFGTASKDTQNPLGNSMLIAYAGFGVSLAGAEGWATALWKATLRDRGVRRIWAVQGPSDPSYSQKEIGNSKIAAALAVEVDGATKFVLALGHSSGSFVAHELFDQLAGGADPQNATQGKVVYFDLDGGGGFTQAAIDRLRKAYFVGAHDGSTLSPNHAEMASLGSTYAPMGGFFDVDGSASGCNPGAEWCVHMTLVTTRPHDPTNSDPVKDYTDFAMRPVQTSFIDAKATEAGL